MLFIQFFFFKQCDKKKKRSLTQENCAQKSDFWLNKLTKLRKKSRNTTKCHDIFITFILFMAGPSLIFYYLILE